MNIYEMTRKDFENLEVTQSYSEVECDSIVILPRKERYDESGYAYYSAILCKDFKPVAKLRDYDIFLFFSKNNIVHGIDVLYKSMLTRVILTEKLKASLLFHSINTLMEDYNDRIRN